MTLKTVRACSAWKSINSAVKSLDLTLFGSSRSLNATWLQCIGTKWLWGSNFKQVCRYLDLLVVCWLTKTIPVKVILCHYVLKNSKGPKSFWRHCMSISWPMCTSLCWCVVNGYHFAPQELSKRWDICPNINSSLSWVNRACCECWMGWTVLVLTVTWWDTISLKMSFNLPKMKMP